VLRLAEKLRTRLVRLPRRHKRLIQVATDVVLVWAALWLSFLVRLGNPGFVEPIGGHAWLFGLAPLISIPLFVRLGMYRAVMRYFGNDALMAIGKAVTLSALLLALAVYWRSDAPKLIPRSALGDASVLYGRLVFSRFTNKVQGA
jgi:FlaA1/EpsC-like NDP-sugar epimerase